MSAFIVDNSVIDTIIAFWRYTARNQHISVPRFASIDKLESPQYRSELGQRMLALNVRSVNERYPAAHYTCDSYEETCVMPPSAIQALKSLECFLYQSCEGTCNKRKLFRVLSRQRNEIARAIVHSMPAYEAARWG